MSEINTIYHPLVVEDTPFPETTVTPQLPQNQGAGGIYSPTVVSDQIIPVKRIARELLSQAINTKSKKILQQLELTQFGGLQIGKFVAGVSGDLRLTGSGLVARDLAGNETIAVDGDTGDVVIAGEIRSGSTITGSVEILGGGYLLLYASDGLPSIFLGEK